MSGGASRPYDTYLVKPDWIQNMLQMGKMTQEDARAELLRTTKCIPRQMDNMDRLAQETERMSLAEHIREVQRELEGKRLQTRVIPAVTEWLRTFDTLEPRYRFLVLDGPSKTGKSLCSRSLSPCREKYLEVDCSGTEFPDLRAYKALQHTYVLFDEASPSLIVRNKKLFQASASLCKLGSSPTNQNAYDVWFHQVRVIVASNKWAWELKSMSHEDASWVQENSVYVRVDGPLWIESPSLEPLAQPAESQSQGYPWLAASMP